MIAFLFGLFIFLFIGIGLFKVFGAKKMGKSIISSIVLIVGGLIASVLLIKFILALGPSGVGTLYVLGIIIFAIVVILLIIYAIVKIFGAKLFVKFILFVFGIIVFIAIAIGALVYVANL